MFYNKYINKRRVLPFILKGGIDMKKLLFLVALASLALTKPAYADEITNADAIRMTEEIYADFSEEQREIAVNSVKIAIGETEPVEYSGYILVGQCSRDAVTNDTTLTPVADHYDYFEVLGDRANVLLDMEDWPTEESEARDRQRIKTLYDQVMTVKAMTAEMSETDKIRVIYNYLVGCLSYDDSCGSGVSVCLESGRANCRGYSGLFEILAKNCGINDETCSGINSAGHHKWNEVVLSDGTRYVVDVSAGERNNNPKYCLMAVDEYYSRCGVVRTPNL
jgi:hypothetical protein